LQERPIPRRVPIPRRRTAVVLAATGLAALLFASPYVVSQSSMASSIRPGEIVLVDRVTPEVVGFARGDVVIFHPPVPDSGDAVFIKRVIGLPGDTISIRDGVVELDGIRLDEPYAAGMTRVENGEPSTWVVSPGSVFVLGDNREGSWDSRGFGPVPLASILGRAWLGFVPLAAVDLLSRPTGAGR
jgi:signal peptidase I